MQTIADIEFLQELWNNMKHNFLLNTEIIDMDFNNLTEIQKKELMKISSIVIRTCEDFNML